MADSNKRLTDRREGRLLRSVPAFSRLTPFLMRRRSDATVSLTERLEVTDIERWMRAKQDEGWTGLRFSHLLIAAYVRSVSLCPGINRFVAGQRIYARSSIQVSMTVKRAQTITATQTAVKVSFAPTDTVFDVYRRLNEALDEVQADVAASAPELISATLMRFPRFFLRFVLRLLRFLDYHDWLPRSYLDASPFHASLYLTDLGVMGVTAMTPHLPDFGTLPCAISFGAKRKEPGDISERRYVDLAICCDERIADAYYFTSAFKCLKYFLKNPRLLELPPEKVEEDVN